VGQVQDLALNPHMPQLGADTLGLEDRVLKEYEPAVEQLRCETGDQDSPSEVLNSGRSSGDLGRAFVNRARLTANR
jgi:hypothetical protein